MEEALKVTGTPIHVGFVPDVMAIDAVGLVIVLTVMVTMLLVIVVGLAQVAFEVKIQATTSPFASKGAVWEILFVPTFVPFSCH